MSYFFLNESTGIHFHHQILLLPSRHPLPYQKTQLTPSHIPTNQPSPYLLLIYLLPKRQINVTVRRNQNKVQFSYLWTPFSAPWNAPWLLISLQTMQVESLLQLASGKSWKTPNPPTLSSQEISEPWSIPFSTINFVWSWLGTVSWARAPCSSFSQMASSLRWVCRKLWR